MQLPVHVNEAEQPLALPVPEVKGFVHLFGFGQRPVPLAGASQFPSLFVKYRPHFFGPYSDSVTDATDRMEALGYIDQTYSGVGGSIRHDYRVTSEGKRLYRRLKKLHPDIVKTAALVSILVKTPGWDNVQIISWAAKVDLIVRRAKRPMTHEAIAKEASELGWKVGEGEIRDDVVNFLVSVGLAKVAD